MLRSSWRTDEFVYSGLVPKDGSYSENPDAHAEQLNTFIHSFIIIISYLLIWWFIILLIQQFVHLYIIECAHSFNVH